MHTVARGPVPRERWSAPTMARETRSHARVACEGPRPTMKGPYCIETGRSLLPVELDLGDYHNRFCNGFPVYGSVNCGSCNLPCCPLKCSDIE